MNPSVHAKAGAACSVSDGGLYVLIKRGLYWRPNSAGYTSDLLRAGLYTEKESASCVNSSGGDVSRELACDAIARMVERVKSGHDGFDARLVEMVERALAGVPLVKMASAISKGGAA